MLFQGKNGQKWPKIGFFKAKMAKNGQNRPFLGKNGQKQAFFAQKCPKGDLDAIFGLGSR